MTVALCHWIGLTLAGPAYSLRCILIAFAPCPLVAGLPVAVWPIVDAVPASGVLHSRALYFLRGTGGDCPDMAVVIIMLAVPAIHWRLFITGADKARIDFRVLPRGVVSGGQFGIRTFGSHAVAFSPCHPWQPWQNSDPPWQKLQKRAFFTRLTWQAFSKFQSCDAGFGQRWTTMDNGNIFPILKNNIINSII